MRSWKADLAVERADGGRIAVRDFGGDGPPLLLLHGLGGTLLAWSAVARMLTDQHRVLAMDLRGHGRSADGPWTWPGAIGDVEAVLRHFAAPQAALVGHSLGGVLAVRYARVHGKTRAVVNLDGRNVNDPAMYRGLEARYVRARLAQLRQEQDAQFRRRLTAAQVEAVVTAAEGAEVIDGAAPARGDVAPAFIRCLSRRDDGTFELRPGAAIAETIVDALDEVDIFDDCSRVACPTLLVCATRTSPSGADRPWLAELQAAHLRGVQERLRALVREHEHLESAFVDATHGGMLRDPALIRAMSVWLRDKAS
jgi:pimeloyl-ACP methyl ester carboxylesterase